MLVPRRHSGPQFADLAKLNGFIRRIEELLQDIDRGLEFISGPGIAPLSPSRVDALAVDPGTAAILGRCPMPTAHADRVKSLGDHRQRREFGYKKYNSSGHQSVNWDDCPFLVRAAQTCPLINYGSILGGLWPATYV